MNKNEQKKTKRNKKNKIGILSIDSKEDKRNHVFNDFFVIVFKGIIK
jgi:hypothetical protein